MKTIKELPNISPMKWKVIFRSVGQICGGRPQTEVSESYLEDLITGTLGEQFKGLTDKEKAEKMKEWKKKSLSVFRRMPDAQLALGGNQLKAAIKETASVGGVGLKQAIQHGVRVDGVKVEGIDYLPLFREGKAITKGDNFIKKNTPINDREQT